MLRLQPERYGGGFGQPGRRRIVGQGWCNAVASQMEREAIQERRFNRASETFPKRRRNGPRTETEQNRASNGRDRSSGPASPGRLGRVWPGHNRQALPAKSSRRLVSSKSVAANACHIIRKGVTMSNETFAIVWRIEAPLASAGRLADALALLTETADEPHASAMNEIIHMLLEHLAQVGEEYCSLFRLHHPDRERFEREGWPADKGRLEWR